MLDTTDISELRGAYKTHLDSALSKVPSYTPSASMLQEQWSGMVWPGSADAEQYPDTGVERDVLVKVGKASIKVPDGFVGCFIIIFECENLNWEQEIHPKLQRHVKNRLQSIETGKGIDWATAEVCFGLPQVRV